MRIISNPEEFRNNIVLRLDLIMKNEKNSRNLERGVYNFALNTAATRKVVKKWDNIHFVQIYIDRLRSVYLNLKPELVEQVDGGIIKAHTIAFMTHQQLQPEKWEKMIQDKIMRDKYKGETTIEASTDTFTCRKCRSKKCTYTQQQTRSADEPMTTFVTCLDCGNHWKC